MKKLILCMFVFAASVFAAEVDKAQLDLFKKESASMRSAIDDIVNTTVSGRGVIESTKGTYLEGYGAVFTLEAALAPTRNPFSSPQSPAEVRAIVAQRRTAIEAKLADFLKQRVASLQSLGQTDSVSVAIHLYDSNPVDVPDLPSQIVFTVKKQNPTQVVLRPY